MESLEDPPERVIHYDDNRSTVRRRRTVEPTHHQAEPEVPPEYEIPRQAPEPKWKKYIKYGSIFYWLEEFAIWRIEFQETFNRYRRTCVTIMATIAFTCIVLMLAVFAFAGDIAVHDAGNETNVAAFYDSPFAIGADFSRLSQNISCNELRYEQVFWYSPASLAANTSNDFLASHQNHSCVCSPMFGMFVRLITVRHSDDVNLQLFNPKISVTTAAVHDRMCVPETQRFLFPKRETVRNIRYYTIRVLFSNADAECSQSNIEVSGETAYCIQSCYDLLDGVTVYDKHATNPC